MSSSGPETAPPQRNRVHFSTDAIPVSDRIALWREEFGRKFVHLDMEPLDDDPLHYAVQFQMLGDASIGLGTISSISSVRTKRLIQDGNDNIVLLLPETDVLRAQLGQFDQTLRPGDCLVHRSNESGRTLSRAGRFLTLALPVQRLAERIRDADSLSIGVLPAGTAEIHLLSGYCKAVMSGSGALSAETDLVVRDHLLDLAALAIGANRDTCHMAQDRGLRAARLAQARGEIRRNAGDPEYRIADLSGAMRLSESAIRKILAQSGDSFSSLLREARLQGAWEKLTDPRHRDRPIGVIALDSGFGDISYFNRVFRRRFHLTPTECRASGS